MHGPVVPEMYGLYDFSNVRQLARHNLKGAHVCLWIILSQPLPPDLIIIYFRYKVSAKFNFMSLFQTNYFRNQFYMCNKISFI